EPVPRQPEPGHAGEHGAKGNSGMKRDGSRVDENFGLVPADIGERRGHAGDQACEEAKPRHGHNGAGPRRNMRVSIDPQESRSHGPSPPALAQKALDFRGILPSSNLKSTSDRLTAPASR